MILQKTEEGSVSSHFGFSIVVRDPSKSEELRRNLGIFGFQTRPIVTGNILRHPVSKYFSKEVGQLFSADKVHYDGIMVTSYLRKSHREDAGRSLREALVKTFCD